MAINLPQKPRAGMHAIHELTKSINGVIDYLSTFLFSGDGFIKVNRSMFRADFSLDLEKLKKKLELENIHTEYDGFFKAELISQNFTPEEEAELDESGYYHGVLQITSGAPSSLNGYSYMYLNGYQLRFYSVSDFSPVKRGFLCIYVRIDPETDRGIDYGYVIESTFPENRDTSILKYPIAWIYRTGDEWKVFQIVRYEIPSLYLFDYPGSFLCSVSYQDENSARTFHLLVSKGFPDQNQDYCGTYANADGSNLQSVSRQTVEIPSAGTYEARVYRDGQIRLRNLNAAIPDFNQPSVEDYVILGRIEIPAEAYEIPPETDGLIFPDYRVTQIWKGDNIYKNNSIWTGSFRLEARLSEDETKVLARISDAYELTSGRVKIHYNRDNQNDYLTVNYPAGSVEVPLSGTSAWMLFHFEYDANQQIPELNVTGETVIAPEIRYNATNIAYGNYIKPSYSSALIGRIRARNQFSYTVTVDQIRNSYENGDWQITEDRYKQGPIFLCDFIREVTRSTAVDGALEITETATGIRCFGGTLHQAGIRSFAVESQDLELQSGRIIVFLKYDYENDTYIHGIQYLTDEIQNDQWTWWTVIAYVSHYNTGWAINQVENMTGEVLGRWL